MAVLKLKKPIMIDGKETAEIKYDLENLTGEDIQQAIRDLNKHQIVTTAVEIDSNYHAALFAKASDIMFEDMSRMGAKDYQKATTIVRDFFLEDTAE